MSHLKKKVYVISSVETGNFLRSGKLHLPENFGKSLQLCQEADFYQIVLCTVTILLVGAFQLLLPAGGQLRPVERHLALLCLTRTNLLHALGPCIHPRLTVDDFVAAYNKLTLNMLSLLPLADVFSTDTPPQQSAGFMTNKARNAGRKMGEGHLGEKHHHFTIGHLFHGVDKGKEDKSRW